MIVPMNGKTAMEVERIDGVITSIAWESLLPAISGLGHVRPDEMIDGLMITGAGIKVKISRRRTRKLKGVAALPKPSSSKKLITKK